MGLLSVFKNLDLKDKADEVWNTIDDPLKGVLESLNRPAGASRGALASLFDSTPNNGIDNIIAGWKDPNKFQPNIHTPLPDVLDKAANIGVQVVTDPLTYIPLAGEAGLGIKVPRYLRPLLTPVVENQTFGRTALSEIGLNAAARAGSEVGAKYTKGTPLEGIGGIAGGLVAGGLTARKLNNSLPSPVANINEHRYAVIPPEVKDSEIVDFVNSGNKRGNPTNWFVHDTLESAQKEINTLNSSGDTGFRIVDQMNYLKPNQLLGGPKSSLLGEQLNEPVPHPADVPPSIENPQPDPAELFNYMDTLDKNPSSVYTVDTNKGARTFNSQDEATKFVQSVDPLHPDPTSLINSRPIGKSPYQNFVDTLYQPETATDYNVLDTHTGVDYTQRNINLIPLDAAIENMDHTLNDSHGQFTTRFYAFGANPKVNEGLSGWIGSFGKEGSQTIRNWFTNGTEEGQLLHQNGQSWRDYIQSLPESQGIKDINGSRYVFMVRGESAPAYRLENGKMLLERKFGQAYDAIDPTTGEVEKFNLDPTFQTDFVGDKGTPLTHNEISKAERVDTLPVFPEGQSVNSFSTDPRIYDPNSEFSSTQGFVTHRSVENPLTGELEKKATVIGVWHPLEDVIGPFGYQSGQKEFFVMDRNLMSDEAFQNITGHAKDAPQITQYNVNYKEGDYLEPGKATQTKTFNSLEEAQNFLGPQPKLVSTDPNALFDIFSWEENGKYYLKQGVYSPQEMTKEALDQYLSEVPTRWKANIYEGKPPENIQGTISTSTVGGYSADLAELRQITPTGEAKIPQIEVVQRDVNNFTDSLIDPNMTHPGEQVRTRPFTGFPIGGGALTPPEFEKLITSYGYDKKVAQQLDALSPKNRADLANIMVNNLGAQGADAEFMDLVINGYKKAGIQDASKISKLNNMFRGAWATGDSSWFGIQGLLSLPRMLVKGDFKDAWDTLTVPMLTMAGNKAALSKWVKSSIDRIPANAPGINEIRDDLHLAFLKGNVDFDFRVLDRLVPFLHPDDAFVAAGDVARLSMFYNEWARFGENRIAKLVSQSKGTLSVADARASTIKELATAMNRATGMAEHPFGGQIGSFALFAPRFFQSQLDTITKAFTDGTLEGTLARKQLIAMVGTGVALTATANYLRGYSPIGVDESDIHGNNPLEILQSVVENPNFMRIRNIDGNDVSVFGPWDSLAKLMVHLGSGDLGYARTKLGPLPTLAINIIKGSDFIGQQIESNPYKIVGSVAETAKNLPSNLAAGDYSSPGDAAKSIGGALTAIDPASRNAIKSLILPFAWQEIGKENWTGGALNLFGVKNSPLSASERIDSNMENLGLNPNDPLDRRAYIADHPDEKPLFNDQAKQAEGYRDDAATSRQLNDSALLDNSKKLVDWREARKTVSRTLMDKLSVIYQGSEFKSDTPQKRTINSYYALFQQAQDPITHDIDSQKFDQLQAEWVAKNGPDALDYVNRYLQIGKSPAELQYLSDMQQLDKLGYFGLKKYDDTVYQLTGKLTDDQIQNYRDQVSAARSANPELGAMTFENAMYQLLGDTLTPDQIYGLDLAGRDFYGNIAVDNMKEQYPQLFQWFNPNATWNTYQTAKGTAAEVSPHYAVPILSKIGR